MTVSLFTVYEPTTRRVVRRVGRSTQSGTALDAAYRAADRACIRGLVFDDSCPHDTAYSLCTQPECAGAVSA